MNKHTARNLAQTNWTFLGLSLILTLSQVGYAQTYTPVTYIQNDLFGNPIAASDAAGTVLWQERYQPFGEKRILVNPPNSGTSNSAENRIAFHMKERDVETGLQYFGARYYDPVLGRFLSIDPAGVSASNVHSFNRFSYANNNAYRYFDPDGKRSQVIGGVIYISPEDPTVPKITLPNNVGATGVDASSWTFHTYDVRTPTGLSGERNAAAIGRGIQNDPTPGNDSPASPEGTINMVGGIPSAGNTNFVRSYYVTSPDPSRYTDISVNHTIAYAHGLHEGYVIRYGEIGSDGTITLRSYGEGDNWRQAPLSESIWGPAVQNTWQSNQTDIVNNLEF